VRPNVDEDLEAIMEQLEEIEPDNIYGECIHIRGKNISMIRSILREDVKNLGVFDLRMESLFKRKLKEHGLRGTWWPEHIGSKGT
jgi:DNA repair photolyase